MQNRRTKRSGTLFMAVILTALTTIHAEENTNKTPHLYETPAEKRDVAGITLKEGISIGGLIEVEAYAGKEDGENVSDVTLATFELGIEGILNKWVQGRALLLWEEDDTEPVDLDEAIIILNGNEIFPAHIKAGKMYIPFGAFNSHFITDPLTLELAETRESALLAGFSNDLLEINIGGFNGDLNEEDNKANDFFTSITYILNSQLRAGGYWISNIGESDTLEEMVNENIHNDESGHTKNSSIAGTGGFISLQVGRFVADAEYITAVESFKPGTLDQTKLRPVAWNIETGIRFNVCEAEIALKYEGSNDTPGFAKKQYGVGSSLRIAKSATLAIEYLHGTFEGDSEDRNIVTTQLAMEF